MLALLEIVIFITIVYRINISWERRKARIMAEAFEKAKLEKISIKDAANEIMKTHHKVLKKLTD